MAANQVFQYDVFLSHSAKDKAAVRASSLSASNGERAGVRCRSLLLAERLRKDGTTFLHSTFFLLPFPEAPIKGSLAQFLYINWRSPEGEQELPNSHCSAWQLNRRTAVNLQSLQLNLC
jgi:hypothetical protein